MVVGLPSHERLERVGEAEPEPTCSVRAIPGRRVAERLACSKTVPGVRRNPVQKKRNPQTDQEHRKQDVKSTQDHFAAAHGDSRWDLVRFGVWILSGNE